MPNLIKGYKAGVAYETHSKFAIPWKRCFTSTVWPGNNIEIWHEISLCTLMGQNKNGLKYGVAGGTKLEPYSFNFPSTICTNRWA